ncbi:MAG: hypothetical protein HON90_14630 [Halobacteriovoraceae bacterium]|jgi:hypothetical protein|nr:hypothetical protein [Halobacteriovoraceae bacterium]
MRRVLAALFILLPCYSISSYAYIKAGGVDVGNTHPIKKVQYQAKGFSTESALIEHIDKLRPSLINGTDGKISAWIRAGACDVTNVEFVSVDLNIFHKYNRFTKTFTKKYQGKININLKDCLTPGLIIDDSTVE